MEVPIKVIVDNDNDDVNDGEINGNMLRRAKILLHNTATTASSAVTKSSRLNKIMIKNYNTVSSSGSSSSMNVKGKSTTTKRVYQTTDQYLASMQRVIDLSLLFLHEQAHVLFY